MSPKTATLYSAAGSAAMAAGEGAVLKVKRLEKPSAADPTL